MPDEKSSESSRLDAPPVRPEQILSMLDSMPQCIYILDAEGNFVYVNSAFVKYTETSKDILLGRNVKSIRHTFNPCISEKVHERKAPVTMFQDIITRSKKTYRQLATATPIFDAEGKIQFIVISVNSLLDFNERFQAATANEVSRFVESLDTFPAEGGKRVLVSASRQMKNLLILAKRLADTDSTCLITGESGTGKEVVAQYIHSSSRRRDRPFVTINCAALPENLMEAELFGYAPGAFTGAQKGGKQGSMEAADGGTLFLDEINSLPLSLQGKLLRALETKMVKKVGSVKEQYVDFRLIVASNQDLFELSRKGSFREDLYYRLALAPLEIPPLRERIDDIIPLADLFLQEFCIKHGKRKAFTSQCYESLLGHSWPGNVRELRNCVESILITSSDDTVSINSLPENLLRGGRGPGENPDDLRYIFIDAGGDVVNYEERTFCLKDYMDGVERKIMENVARTYGNTYRIAEVLKLNQSTVVRKLQKYGISAGQAQEAHAVPAAQSAARKTDNPEKAEGAGSLAGGRSGIEKD